MGNPFEGADVIHTYSRAQALADGVLVDVSELAREAGFTVPVAMTVGAWTEMVKWDHGGWQDETGRLWDVVWMASFAIKTRPAPDPDARLTYELYRVPNQAEQAEAELVRLDLHSGPGDEGEHVITILLPGED